MPSIEIDIDGLIPATRRLRALIFRRGRKDWELTKLSRKVISNSKKRVRQQTDLDGVAYHKRNRKRKDRRKMLLGIAQRLQVMRNDGSNTIISLPGRSAGIASAQQYGQIQPQGGENDGYARNNPATKKQAKALRELGYKVGGRKATISYITSNLKTGQAGAIIKWLREQQGLPARTRRNNAILPARSYLGATQAEIEELTKILINDITEDI